MKIRPNFAERPDLYRIHSGYFCRDIVFSCYYFQIKCKFVHAKMIINKNFIL
jgi:hypothetical protein